MNKTNGIQQCKNAWQPSKHYFLSLRVVLHSNNQIYMLTDEKENSQHFNRCKKLTKFLNKLGIDINIRHSEILQLKEI